jgi:hypothetical protein
MAHKSWMNFSGTDAENIAAGKIVAKSDDNARVNSGIGYTQVSYHMKGLWHDSTPFGSSGKSLFDLPEAGYISRPGAPMLIQEGLFVVLPAGAIFNKVEVMKAESQPVKGTFDVLPVPQPAVESEPLRFIRDESIYASNEVYPANTVEYLGTKNIMGVNCAHLIVYPVQYRPLDKEIMVYTNIEIKVSYHLTDALTGSGKISNRRFASRLLGYTEPDRNGKAVDSGEARARMLIITTADLRAALGVYEKAKQDIYDVSVVLMEDIVKKYSGVAPDEALHKYIMDEHHSSAIRYLILGGDVDKIPVHLVEDPVAENPFASDSYYGTEDKAVPPSFSVGRFPVSDAAAMSKLVNTLSSYRKWYNEKRKDAVFTTFGDDKYEQCSEEIAGQVSSKINVIKCYDGQCDKDRLISAINQGVGFINYRGHGSNIAWQSSIGLRTTDIPGLTVGENIPHVLSIACSNNAIHTPNCFGATWIRNGKAVSFLGAAEESYTLVNQSFDKYLWEAISKENFSIIGDIYVSATLALYQNDDSGEAETNIKEYLLLGDPTANYLENGAGDMWKKGRGLPITLDATASGYEGEKQSFIARAEHGGGVHPGKYVIGFGCFIPYFGAEVLKDEFEYYTGPVQWVKTSGHNIPANAVVGGKEQDGTLLYIGRVLYEGMMIPGKISARVGKGIYFPYNGKEIELPDYEILVSA